MTDAQEASEQPVSGEPAKVSLCMIVKNEEENLRACLDGVHDLVDELVIVDTGSTDQTKAIAEKYDVKVIDFPWVDSFAAARNVALDHATGDFIFWLDADDRVDAANRDKLKTLFAQLHPGQLTGIDMKCVCLPDPVTGVTTVVDHIRLFPRHPNIRWKYRVHEQILPALRQQGGNVRFVDIQIYHVGYQDPAVRHRKLQRDMRLLNLENEEHPDDPFTLFNLGSIYLDLGMVTEAIPLLDRSLYKSHSSASIVRKLYVLLIQANKYLRNYQIALAICEQGRRAYPKDIELLFQEALLLREMGNLQQASLNIQQLLESKEDEHFSSVDIGLRTYKARHNLALIYREMGRNKDAKDNWRQVLFEVPNFPPALIGLAEAYIKDHEYSHADDLIDKLTIQDPSCLDLSLLRIRKMLAQKEISQALVLSQDMIVKYPRDVRFRELFAHALLREGRDPVMAETALCDLLAIDPRLTETIRNLQVLRTKGSSSNWQFPAKIKALYQHSCQIPSDIHEHLPTLFMLASECKHITEMGTRSAVSTRAFLAAQPEYLICYDKVRYPIIDLLSKVAEETVFQFHQADVLHVEMAETDLLFLDTWHVFDQVQAELTKHSCKVRKYIVLHDTTTFGEIGETKGYRGIWAAIEQFVELGTFRIKERFTNNNGITILERIASDEDQQMYRTP